MENFNAQSAPSFCAFVVIYAQENFHILRKFVQSLFKMQFILLNYLDVCAILRIKECAEIFHSDFSEFYQLYEKYMKICM